MENRNDAGQFDLKGDDIRRLRSIRLTDACWDGLLEIAESRGISRPDFLESLVEDGDFSSDTDDIEDRDTLLEAIREVRESLEPGEESLIELKEHRDRAPGRRILDALLEYLESI